MNDEQKNREGAAIPARDSEPKTSMTRREWLLGAGGAALAAGLPLMPASVNENVGLDHDEAAPVNLPPGLYLPSPSHLAHALESDQRFHAIPAGSETDYTRPVSSEFQPSFFSQSEFGVIRRWVSILLGLPDASGSAAESETGGENVVDATAQFIDLQVTSARGISEASRALSPQHRTLATHYYGAEAVSRVETSDPGKICRDGMAWLDEASQEKHGASFLDLTLTQQTEMVKAMSDREAEGTSQNAGTRFFRLLKDETIRGYYTSRAGLYEIDDKSHSFHVFSPGCPGKLSSSRTRG